MLPCVYISVGTFCSNMLHWGKALINLSNVVLCMCHVCHLRWCVFRAEQRKHSSYSVVLFVRNIRVSRVKLLFKGYHPVTHSQLCSLQLQIFSESHRANIVELVGNVSKISIIIVNGWTPVLARRIIDIFSYWWVVLLLWPRSVWVSLLISSHSASWTMTK